MPEGAVQQRGADTNSRRSHDLLDASVADPFLSQSTTMGVEKASVNTRDHSRAVG